MNLEIRKATKADIKDIKILLSYYYLETEKVEKNLPEFIVAVLDNKTVGCACLDIDEVVELRSIAVLPGFRNKGIGSRLVDAIVSRATQLSDTVYLRTTSPGFFEKKRFQRLPNPEKKVIWNECMQCDKYDICRQALMKLVINFND
jgi:amino-acid N-acetyltransferase